MAGRVTEGIDSSRSRGRRLSRRVDRILRGTLTQHAKTVQSNQRQEGSGKDTPDSRKASARQSPAGLECGHHRV